MANLFLSLFESIKRLLGAEDPPPCQYRKNPCLPISTHQLCIELLPMPA